MWNERNPNLLRTEQYFHVGDFSNAKYDQNSRPKTRWEPAPAQEPQVSRTRAVFPFLPSKARRRVLQGTVLKPVPVFSRSNRT